MKNSIQNGCPWFDTEGKPLHAHGGSVMYVDGYYYFYGENKEKTFGTDDTWQWGMKIYRSRDLYNWEDLGCFILPVPEDKASPFHPISRVDRPHILYNKKTKKFVCWVKIMDPDSGIQASTVLTSDKITGPYTVVRTGLIPLGMSAGDFDLVADECTGRGYYYFERVHDATICADLTEDYTDVAGSYSLHFPPPGDASHTSFHSQISSVFKVPGKKDLYIACADRWMPEYNSVDYHTLLKIRDLKRSRQFDKMRAYLKELNLPVYFSAGDTNTSIAEYIWLPIRFEGEMAIIDWKDEWRIEDYE